MNKIEKVLTGLFGIGIGVYLAYCIRKGIRYGFAHGVMKYFADGFDTVYGMIFTLSCIGLFTLLIGPAMRKNKDNNVITTADKIWFVISFVPISIVILYGLYSAVFGIDFLWSKSYGLSGFCVAALMGGILSVPVLPLCVMWQVTFLAVRRRIMSNKKELSI